MTQKCKEIYYRLNGIQEKLLPKIEEFLDFEQMDYDVYNNTVIIWGDPKDVLYCKKSIDLLFDEEGAA